MSRIEGLRPHLGPEDVLAIAMHEFGGVSREGGLFQLAMHPHIIGDRSRPRIVEELIRAAMAKGDVWFATHTDIAAHAAAAELGVTVSAEASGGGSDGNGIGALGVPTLDGLGPLGAGLHAHDEHLEFGSLGPR